jgi:transposase-like protein
MAPSCLRKAGRSILQLGDWTPNRRTTQNWGDVGPKASQDELAVLKRELARLKEENEILKKAAAYFARELP